MKKTIFKTLTLLSLLMGFNSFSQTYKSVFDIVGGSAQSLPSVSNSNVLIYGTGGIMRLANAVSITDGIDSSNSTLKVQGSSFINGSQKVKYVTKFSNYTVSSTDYVVADTLTGAVITLPPAGENTGKIFYILNYSAGNQTVQGTINGVVNKTISTKTTLLVISNGVSFFQLSYN